jgi:hypothetical protein
MLSSYIYIYELSMKICWFEFFFSSKFKEFESILKNIKPFVYVEAPFFIKLKFCEIITPKNKKKNPMVMTLIERYILPVTDDSHSTLVALVILESTQRVLKISPFFCCVWWQYVMHQRIHSTRCIPCRNYL